MAVHHRLFILSIAILIVLSSCNGFQLYRDSPTVPLRPIKYHILSNPDRYADRMKQYRNTITQLRLWRRYLDEVNDDDENTSQG